MTARLRFTEYLDLYWESSRTPRDRAAKLVDDYLLPLQVGPVSMAMVAKGSSIVAELKQTRPFASKAQETTVALLRTRMISGSRPYLR